MNNGLQGPSDTVTGGKTLILSDYDKTRSPHKPITDGTRISVNTRTLAAELSCPICLDLLTNTWTTKECLHRFCEDCITTALMRGNKECPTCRNKIVSKRSLRPDPNFDFLISKIWPDRKQYEDMQAAATKTYHEQNKLASLQKGIQEGIKAQAASRKQRVKGSYDYEKKKRRPKLAETNGGEEDGPGTSTSITLNNSGANSSLLASQPSNCSIDSNSPSPPQDEEMTDLSGGQNESNHVNDTNISADTFVTAPEVPSSSPSDVSGVTSSEGSSDTSSDSSESSGSEVSSQHSETTNSLASELSITREEPQVEVKPPLSFCNDKTSKWLEENPSSPLTPGDDCIESETGLGVGTSADIRLEEIRKRGEEIDVELVPAKSLLNRTKYQTTPPSMLRSRYVRAPPDITMQHFGEYLHRLWQGEIIDQTGSSVCNGVDLAPRPEYFYILDHNKQLRKIFLHESLYSAFTASVLTEEHLMIFYDTSPPDMNKDDKLILEVISEQTLARLLLYNKKLLEEEDSNGLEVEPVASTSNGMAVHTSSSQKSV